jgi:RNA polymerase sigma-70 factor (ECF subfamily)
MNKDRDDGFDDEALLTAALRAGDQAARDQAVTRLLTRHQRRVYLWCYRLVRDHERALELAQDVLLSAWRHLESFGGRARFSSWLFALARNRCLSELRRSAPSFARACDIDALIDAHGDPERCLLERVGEEELLHLIRAELDGLEQEALWLRCFDGMPVDAITEVLDIRDASGARAVLQRARRKLRAALDRREWLEDGARA